MLEGDPREVRWTLTPSKGKDADSSDSRKAFIILMFSLVLQILLDFFFPSVVVVNFVGTMKSN